MCIITLSSSIHSQEQQDWQQLAETQFVKLLQSAPNRNLDKIRIQLWTVSPGQTVTTAFGHTALRIFEGEDYGDKDFYLDFGVYDPSPGFLWRFLKGEAAFFVNIIPTNSAYQTWDASGRGVTATELQVTNAQKAKLLAAMLKSYNSYKDGYFYENFTQNCVTFIRDILSEGLEKRMELTEIDSEKNTWRARVLPYSTSIFWLNIEETLLFDHDTDSVRDPNELIYLPDDLLKALQESGVKVENTTIIPDRWPPRDGRSSAIWMVMYLIMIGFALPFPFLQMFERVSEVIYGIVSVVGGLAATLVFFLTSFSFMDQTLAWLVFSPLDYYFLKAYSSWRNKKVIHIIILLRIFMLVTALLLNLFVYDQVLANILFLSFFVHICYAWKRKEELKLFLLPGSK
ncbi:lipoprotein N-acyltransferase Lnb domain-containing protein [Leptospira sp. GIMC2001]|uniref:lipoprotein N-acyltransferase Lnb domain-containing protein n=1 Tax=Leptospira sp. GIMC2001 TaxID=1513297 RepID=UPI00234AE4B3|nr:DUF4105 domain-containing protein [Leptospira sp. GIMC2001]WCL49568.1 DUF4105 domain-containing protein [Leptospira sp. GIMC2001]